MHKVGGVRKTETPIVGASNKWLRRPSDDSVSIGFSPKVKKGVTVKSGDKVTMMGVESRFSVRPERDEMTL